MVDLIIGEGNTLMQAETDFELKKIELLEEHPDVYLSHLTNYNKYGKFQIVQHYCFPKKVDATETVMTGKVKHKGF